MLVENQKDRLDAPWTPSDIDKISSQFGTLCSVYSNDELLKVAMDACDHTSFFDNAWPAPRLIGFRPAQVLCGGG